MLLINAALTILFLSETYAGSTHDKRIADATPYPLPAGSRLLQDLGFLAFTLEQVEIRFGGGTSRQQLDPDVLELDGHRFARVQLQRQHA